MIIKVDPLTRLTPRILLLPELNRVALLTDRDDF